MPTTENRRRRIVFTPTAPKPAPDAGTPDTMVGACTAVPGGCRDCAPPPGHVFTEEQLTNIANNVKNGLLCACNKEMIPYYGPDGHACGGTKKTEDGVLHAYEDCG